MILTQPLRIGILGAANVARSFQALGPSKRVIVAAVEVTQAYEMICNLSTVQVSVSAPIDK
jgi:hypothetical protein